MANPTSKTKTAPKKASKPANSEPQPTIKLNQPTRLDQLEQLIIRESGASITELTGATGWQPHSVRGAIAGALKKRGLSITSEKVEGVRRYHGVLPA